MIARTSIAIFGSRDVDRDTSRTLFEQHLASFVDQGRTRLHGGARWAPKPINHTESNTGS